MILLVKRFSIVAFVIALPHIGLAQKQQTLEGTLQDVSKDLAVLHQQVQNAYRATTAWPDFTMGAGSVRTTRDNAVLRAGAADQAKAVTKVPAGATFDVIDRAGEWYAVKLDKPTQGLTTAWVKAADATREPQKRAESDQVKQTSMADQIYEQITKSVTSIRDRYKDNPYVRVSGFTVNVAIPPSVTISFDFVK
jgi:uncharacterized protein YgiM (DUF1202 family)